MVVFTCQQESETLCLNELIKAASGARFVRWLDRGVGMLACAGDFGAFSGAVREAGVIFARHLCPVDYQWDWADMGDWEGAKAETGGSRRSRESAGPQTDTLPQGTAFSEALRDMSARMRDGVSFGVQLRAKPGEAQECLPDIRRGMTSHFESLGFVNQVKRPGQIISGYLAEGRLYLGLSDARDNLSDWAGGMRAYALREDTVSRAEFKLLEALEVFEIPVEPGWTAVDLGAAPGGWSKVLLEKGMSVVAVDPAELATSVAAHPGIRHFRGLAQAFMKDNRQTFDMAVNDMKMDAVESAGIMGDMAGQIRPGGVIVLTLKLYKTDKTATIRKALSRLRVGYDILGVRQLFHNRSEVTVAGRRKG